MCTRIQLSSRSAAAGDVGKATAYGTYLNTAAALAKLVRRLASGRLTER